MCYILVLSVYPPGLVDNEHTNLLNTDSWVCDFFVHVCDYFRANPPFDQSSFVAAFVVDFPLSGWVCQRNPSGSLLGNRSKKAFLEEWIFTGDDSSDEQGFTNFPMLIQSIGNTYYIRDDDLPAPTPARQSDSLRHQDKTYHPSRPKNNYSFDALQAYCFRIKKKCNDCNFTRRRFFGINFKL